MLVLKLIQHRAKITKSKTLKETPVSGGPFWSSNNMI